MANNEKKLADYLPYDYRKKGQNGEETDALKFLKAFDRILLGSNANNKTGNEELDAIEGLEDKIARLSEYFHPAPAKTPSEFLPWLSQWVALSLRVDISEVQQRKFIEKIIPLYRMRGTKTNMVELLKLFVGEGRSVSITEQESGPHFFTVLLDLNDVKDGNSKDDYERAEQKAHSIISLAKPAHTRYQLIPKIDAFRIGDSSKKDQNDKFDPNFNFNSCPNNQDNKTCPIILGRNTRIGIANWK